MRSGSGKRKLVGMGHQAIPRVLPSIEPLISHHRGRVWLPFRRSSPSEVRKVTFFGVRLAGGADGHAAVMIFGQLERAVGGAADAGGDVEQPVAGFPVGSRTRTSQVSTQRRLSRRRLADLRFSPLAVRSTCSCTVRKWPTGTAGNFPYLFKSHAALAAAEIPEIDIATFKLASW